MNASTTPHSKTESASGEVLYILRSLRENGMLGRSNKLAEVKAALEPSVSQEFDTYFFFLRKYHYIAMDREAQLKLTDQGEKVVDGEYLDQLRQEVGQFFGDAPAEEHTQSGILTVEETVPVESHTDLVVDEDPPRPPALRKTKEEPRAVPAVAPLEPPQRAEAAPRPPAGTDLDGRYTKRDEIGQGPLGAVFQGSQNALGLDVAVKELKDIFGYFSFLERDEVQKRLKNELCAQAAVRHPSVVAVLDQNTEAQRPYFVLERCSGSLKEKLTEAAGKGLEPAKAVRWFLQLCYGLRAAHARGLTHHNIKPENVLFDAAGNAKIGDFGMARVVEVDPSKGMPQVFVGTGGMSYMAPELIHKSKDAGPAADVYGLGILLYEVLTGQLPGRRSPLPSEVNPEAPSRLDAIFDKMTQDRLEQRYPDFDAVLADFYAAFPGNEHLGQGDLVLSS